MAQTPPRLELVWPGKLTQVDRVALPFQVVETINQSRAHQPGLSPPSKAAAWTNKLIWGENKYVLASLLHGDPSIGLEPLAGKIDLIYIDPPFATGQDFSYRAQVGDQEWVKEPSIIEETAYRDTWGRGLNSYLQTMYERLQIMRDLLAEDGSIYLHCDWRVNSALRLLLDEVLSESNYRNEIIWKRTSARSDSETYNHIHDHIYFYSKSDSMRFNTQYVEYDKRYVESAYRNIEEGTGRHYTLSDLMAAGTRTGSSGLTWKGIDPNARGNHWKYQTETLDELEKEGRIMWPKKRGGVPRYKRYLDEMPGLSIQSIWTDVSPVASQSQERLDYATQKPEALLDRIMRASSNEGDLVADFFGGSGTTMAVAEKLGRRWIGVDLSRYAIQVSRKRLLDIPDCKPFQVLNLGKYERKHWQVNVLNGHQGSPDKAVADYYRFILALYHAEPAGGYTHLHGHKAGRYIHVGPVDAPVTRAEVMDAIHECQSLRSTGLDALGWEWEMGLHDTIRDEAKRMGVDLRLLNIPREVMDKQVKPEEVRFFELAYLKTSALRDGRSVTIRLEDFIIPNPDLVPDQVRGKIKKWSDYIDFWAVDWDYQGDTFHNEWQAYRTRKAPTLRLLSDAHTYPSAGGRRIVVKVIDIFGNDTTQLLEVSVP